MKRTLLVPTSIVVVLAAGGYLIDRAREKQQSLVSGYFESQPTLAASRLGGRVEQILVREGDTVKSGQPLVRLEANSFAATFEASQMAAEGAKQQFAETKIGNRPEDIARQEASVREAKAAYDRLINGPLPEEIRAARAKLAESNALYRKALAGSRPEEIASARAAANVAQEKYRQAMRGLTREEIAELKARLDAAVADESLTEKQADRLKRLADEGAIAKQEYDTAQSTYDQARARAEDAAQAYKRGLDGTPKEELAQARETFRQARAQLDLALNGTRKEDIEAAYQEAVAADQSLKLLLRGSRTEDIQAAKARLDQASETLLELRRGNRAEDVARSQAASRQAELEVKSLAETLKESVVYAPRDGQVDRVLVSTGDLVAAGGSVAQLSYPDDIWLRVYLPEAQLPKVKVGDSADLAVDGIAGTVVGTVESISTVGEFTPANLQSPEERGKQVFGIRIRLSKPDVRVKAGMYVTVKRVGKWP
ncbi:MAG: HlyD family efflux transporter periplasmic adaptor subunit [Fimbriimonas sp.]|nr:HlyD family efflux transporter periplasmic adaptor subunit [Fimbriimonas sp.]